MQFYTTGDATRVSIVIRSTLHFHEGKKILNVYYCFFEEWYFHLLWKKTLEIKSRRCESTIFDHDPVLILMFEPANLILMLYGISMSRFFDNLSANLEHSNKSLWFYELESIAHNPGDFIAVLPLLKISIITIGNMILKLARSLL